MVTVEFRAVGRNNNFNLLRMIAATAVLVSHAWPLALGPTVAEPLATATGYKLGTTAVTIFFAVSGFFITKSFDQRNSVSDFLVARVARIYPGLLTVLLLTAFVLGPVFTTLPIGAYLRDRHVWTYVPFNLSLKHLQWGLPGVFLTNPTPPAINGSLWTLFYEICCYAAVVATGLTRISRPITFPLILLTAIAPFFFIPHGGKETLLEAVAILTLPFALGAAAYVYRRYVPLSGWLATGLLTAAALAHGSFIYPLIYALALSYASLWLGFSKIPGLHRYNLLGDYSYGMYIYAYPVEQMVVALTHPIGPTALIAISLPITLLLAVASWTMIEAPTLAHRHTLAARLRVRHIRGKDLVAPDGAMAERL